MAAALPIVTAIASVASVGSSLFGGASQQSSYEDTARAQEQAAQDQEQAAYEAELMADQNARNQEAETLESVRREDLALEQELGSQRARAAASGLSLEDEEDSLGLGLAANRAEGQNQIDWLKSAGMNKADILRWEGDMAKRSSLSDAKYTRSLADISRDKGTDALLGGIFSAAGQVPSAISAGSAAKWW